MENNVPSRTNGKSLVVDRENPRFALLNGYQRMAAKIVDPKAVDPNEVAKLIVRHSPHARFGSEVALDRKGKPQVDEDGNVLTVGWAEKWHTTKRRPWVKKEERRAKNRRSRLARRKNR